MSALTLFRRVAIAEGVSYLLLLGVAMPLKYVWDWPLAVKYVGWAHGLLFVAYCAALLPAAHREKWTLPFTAWAFLASLLPFGTFVLDRQLSGRA